MKIVILDGYTENPGDLSWSPIEALGAVTVYDRTDVRDASLIRQRIGDAEIVLTNKTPLSRETILSAPGLRFIGVLATGYNIVDTAAAKERGIPVCNVPGYSTAAVAQHTMALLLELCSRVALHDAAVHAGQWTACPDFCFWNAPLTELSGKTLGVIGFGSIGRAVGRIARALGMEVLACSRSVRPEGEEIARYVPLEELLRRSDVVSLHCPLFPETEQLINREAIARMKPGAMLINTARGPLLDEQAVADALREGRLAAAAIDVASVEPMPAEHPLLHAPRCIITPHIAWATKESRQRLMRITAQNIAAWQAGAPVHVVNP